MELVKVITRGRADVLIDGGAIGAMVLRAAEGRFSSRELEKL